jgi:hypothetical protein
VIHQTYAPTIVNPDAHYSKWKVYRSNAVFFLNCKGYDELCRPLTRIPLTHPFD